MKWGSLTCGFEDEEGYYSGQANRWVMKQSKKLAHGHRKDLSVECRRVGWIVA
jgi:hypothetical protein